MPRGAVRESKQCSSRKCPVRAREALTVVVFPGHGDQPTAQCAVQRCRQTMPVHRSRWTHGPQERLERCTHRIWIVPRNSASSVRHAIWRTGTLNPPANCLGERAPDGEFGPVFGSQVLGRGDDFEPRLLVLTASRLVAHRSTPVSATDPASTSSRLTSNEANSTTAHCSPTNTRLMNCPSAPSNDDASS